MKSRPVLFSASMIRAILDGRKTQTRRVVRELPGGRGGLVGDHVKWFERGQQDATRWCGHDGLGSLGWVTCPYGDLGDQLWVRETWDYFGRNEYLYQRDPAAVIFRADERPEDTQRRWRPSIFMPRWASRITLEVTEVRVQRLQSISEDDARTEGVDCHHHAVGADRPTYSDSLRLLWDSINGKRAPWSSNPWVWAITFRRLP